MNRKWIVPLIIGCGALCLVAALVVVLGGAAFFRWMMEEPENVNIQVDAPIMATMGETVTLQVSIENLAAEPQLLDSIDIADSYLEGLGIQRADPPFTESYPLGLVDYQSFTFQRDIPAGETMNVQFYVVATRIGDWSGDIDVCIGSGSVCSTFIVRTVVE